MFIYSESLACNSATRLFTGVNVLETSTVIVEFKYLVLLDLNLLNVSTLEQFNR